jgi:hypothetical protein
MLIARQALLLSCQSSCAILVIFPVLVDENYDVSAGQACSTCEGFRLASESDVMETTKAT